MIAAEKDHEAAVTALIDGGAPVDAQDRDGRTAVMLAAVTNAARAVSRLVAGGASLEMRDNDGDTALLLAAREGNLDAVRVLCEAGADLLKVAGGEGSRAMDAARQCPIARASEAIQDYLLDVELDREEA